MRNLRLAPEGWIFVVPVLILALAALLIQWYFAALVFATVSIVLTNLFRDPQRRATSTNRHIISPADGTVVNITNVAEPLWPELTQQMTIVSSMFDVYVNRSPIGGTIRHYSYNPPRANRPSGSRTEEDGAQTFAVIEGSGITVAIRQIAGLLSRRLVFDKREGAVIAQGERIGAIPFGSRVDLFVPADARIVVKQGEKVMVGVTVMAEVEPK